MILDADAGTTQNPPRSFCLCGVLISAAPTPPHPPLRTRNLRHLLDGHNNDPGNSIDGDDGKRKNCSGSVAIVVQMVEMV